MDFTPIINFVGQTTVYAVVGLALAGCAELWNRLRQLLISKTNETTGNLIFEEIRKLVLAAEAYFAGPGRGAEKLQWVLDQAKVVLAPRGYKNLDLDLLKVWVEAALKQEINNQPATTLLSIPVQGVIGTPIPGTTASVMPAVDAKS